MTKILTICGSSRKDSLNRRVVAQMAGFARTLGASVSEVELGNLNIPLYNGDDEANSGSPDGALTLREMMIDAGGFIIGSPEYNGFMSPLLLNALDWVSRDGGKPGLTPYANKVVLLTGASPGPFGAMRAAGHVRTMLSGIGCIVLPQVVSVPKAFNAFAEDGSFADEGLADRAQGAVKRLIEVTEKFSD